MGKKPVFGLLLYSGLILLVILLVQPLEIIQFRDYIDILFPKGLIAKEQLWLLLLIQILMLLIVIPVFFLTYYFSWKYRAGNKKAKHSPDFDHHPIAEYIWWGIPAVFTLTIAAITWIKTHELDPYKPIPSIGEEKVIQAVALQWKWLFIYPEEKIASLNFVQIPKDTPIHFQITADAPMNSLWIPQLGGQIYAMPKMKTNLHLIANEEGDFRGSSANISGEGFASMHFITRATSEEEYKEWVKKAQGSEKSLTMEEYKKLVAPKGSVPPELYRLEEENLFNKIIMNYMTPKSDG